MVPNPTPIFHITHLDNLHKIVESGGLRCCSELRQTNRDYKDIAHQNIQDRRATTHVSCGPKGVLHGYVPFYFAPRSPMLYAIKKGKVAGYSEGQRPLIQLVLSAQAIMSAGLQFVFTDGHGTMAITDFYDDLNDLDKVDWSLMNAVMWNDTTADNDRKRRRQAEFLVHSFVPWELIETIGVINNEIKIQVESAIQSSAHIPNVVISPSWYY